MDKEKMVYDAFSSALDHTGKAPDGIRHVRIADIIARAGLPAPEVIDIIGRWIDAKFLACSEVDTASPRPAGTVYLMPEGEIFFKPKYRI